MVKPNELNEALVKLVETIGKINEVQRDHNRCLIDIYERLAKLEGDQK